MAKITVLKDGLTNWIIEGSNRNIKIKYTLKESIPYFNYKGKRYHLSEFLRTKGVWTNYPILFDNDYHGILNYGYSNGLLLSIDDYGDCVKCYYYKTESNDY